MVQFIGQLLQHSDASGRRSTALQPVVSIGALSFSAAVGSLYFIAAYEIPTTTLSWVRYLPVVFGGIAILCVLVVIGITVYAVCAGKADLLRSERFSLQKLAIERWSGDNTTGKLGILDLEDVLKVSSRSKEKDES